MIETNEETVPSEGSGEAAAKSFTASKSHAVTKLLRRAKGATIAEIQESTTWQPHSVRAFLSGLRKKGSAVAKEQRKSGETTYRLSAKAAPTDAADA